MSADLFEAFVGKQTSRSNSQESPNRYSSRLLIQPDSPSKPEDTWQSWPTVNEFASAPSNHQSQTLWESDDKGNDVLFDAGGLDADPDDFGDFEQAVTKRPDDRPATANLLDLDADEIASKEATDTKSSSEAVASYNRSSPLAGRISQIAPEETPSSAEEQDEWGDFESIEVPSTISSRPPQREASRNSPAPIIRGKSSSTGAKPCEKTMPNVLSSKPGSVENEPFEEEPWDNFDDDKPENSNASKNLAISPLQQNPLGSVVTADVVPRDRPTNVPPPAVLLAWLPNVFSVLATQARQSNEDAVAGINALKAYRVSARVIAGRAARWKRDTILAQSMKIGAAGRSGGMKLTALDKGESRKEDQAAEEVVASWNRFSHVLNAAIVRAKAQKPSMALSSKLSARMATGLDVVSATHICAICGLRRNERVIGIDVSVSDIFGEFWVEHWGHKDCADTWYGFNKLLDQR